LDGTRVIIQGFGNVGSSAARLMMEQGYKIIGVAEYDGGLYNSAGIDILALLITASATATMVGIPGAEADALRRLLTHDCDILIPAATENVITSRNADQVKARIIVEGANGPTTAVRTRSWPRSAFSSCPTFWPTPAA
jgi:glutamate dehydrogenase (NAD(P)+)